MRGAIRNAPRSFENGGLRKAAGRADYTKTAIQTRAGVAWCCAGNQSRHLSYYRARGANLVTRLLWEQETPFESDARDSNGAVSQVFQ